jgi:hypothetical protein
MAEMDPESPQPTLTRTQSGRGWRLALVIIVGAVVALVGLTRLGGSDPAATVTPTRAAVLPNPFLPPPRPTLAPVVQMPGVMPRSPDGLTYADGIPTTISNKPVIRVRDALGEPAGRTLLVGGWYRLPHCHPAARSIVVCAASTLSDVPLVQGQGDVRTSFMALDSDLDDVGAHVVLAIVEVDPRCAIRDLGECQARLRVVADLWSGAG